MKKLMFLVVMILTATSLTAQSVRVVEQKPHAHSIENVSRLSTEQQQDLVKPHMSQTTTLQVSRRPPVPPGMTCWEVIRRQWIRQPDKDKQFEEYIAITAADYAITFSDCMDKDCSEVRLQNSLDEYVDKRVNDTLILNYYYDMEWYFEKKLNRMDFRHWKQNNPNWRDGLNWREYEKEPGACYA